MAPPRPCRLLAVSLRERIAENLALASSLVGTAGLRPSRVLAAVLGDGLRALGNGVLRQLPWQHQAHCRLDFATRQGAPLVVITQQLRRLRGDAVEDVVHEAVHNEHTPLADAAIRVDLLENLVDVECVGLCLFLRPFPHRIAYIWRLASLTALRILPALRVL